MRMTNLFKVWYLLLAVPFLMLTSCGDDDDSNPGNTAVVASFQAEIDETNFLLVNFTNFSQNATSYEWDFGDGNTSTEKDPSHEYAEAGTYTVILTATGAGGTATREDDVTLTDPDAQLTLLTGSDSKTWKLFREGTSMSLGESQEVPNNWWPGLQNDGSRDCLYEQTFTFHRDGTYTFDDAGSFWGEFGVWDPNSAIYETCFPAEASNMVNLNGDDVSAWLSGTWAYTYDNASGLVTLNGDGAWIGIPKLGETGERLVPTSSTGFTLVSITQETGYDVMEIGFDYGSGGYWKFMYVHYTDPSLEPDLGAGGGGTFGEDLPDETPTAMFNTFASTDAADVQELVPTASDVVMTAGVTDPAGGATAVGEYVRGTAPFADQKFQLTYDCQFTNFDSVVVEVYFPSSNDYSGDLSQRVDIFLADASATQEFWTDWTLYRDESVTAQDTWVRYAWALTDGMLEGVDPNTRTDYDLIGLKIGGENHGVDGTFYVRNFEFK